MSARRRAAGFTLIELLLAFALLALGLTLLLGTLSGASRQLRQGGDAGTAALYAQSLLAEYAEWPLQVGRHQGVSADGRYRWQLQIQPWPPAAAAAAADPRAARLWQVRLELDWSDGGPSQQLHVETLRLALPDAEAVP